MTQYYRTVYIQYKSWKSFRFFPVPFRSASTSFLFRFLSGRDGVHLLREAKDRGHAVRATTKITLDLSIDRELGAYVYS